MSVFSQHIKTAAQSVRVHEHRRIDTAIILGSGLSDFIPELENTIALDYKDIDGLTATSVTSHPGRLIFGEHQQQNVAICQGRHHLYEGYTAQQVTTLVYVLAELGVKRLIITNAAGALNANYSPGDVMLINDHINFTGCNPIVGQDDSLGNRFTDMSQAYNRSMIQSAKQAASENQLQVHRGIYAGVLGPSLETSAERRMLATLGGDAVGMSTVMEVIAANQCAMQVLGLSAITNLALGDATQKVDTIEEVLRYAAVAGEKIGVIIDSVLANKKGAD